MTTHYPSGCFSIGIEAAERNVAAEIVLRYCNRAHLMCFTREIQGEEFSVTTRVRVQVWTSYRFLASGDFERRGMIGKVQQAICDFLCDWHKSRISSELVKAKFKTYEDKRQFPVARYSLIVGDL